MTSDFMKHYVAKIKEHEELRLSQNERDAYWIQWHLDNPGNLPVRKTEDH
jgi:hypothetical protein